jgi:excinuclease ABC subunit A
MAAERKSAQDVPLEDIGKEAPMPWEADGRRWHTMDRVTSDGNKCRWEGQILDWLEKRIHALGPFSATNWNHRTVIEIAATQKSQGWFLHAMTGQEWLLRLVFRVGRNTFKQEDLVRKLGIRPLNETPGLEVYSAEERVHVANMKGPWQSVSIQVHRLGEIDTPAFADFLMRAVESFQHNLKRLRTKPEDVMPWKVNGERWHHSDKGFPVGKKVQWDRGLLARVLDIIRDIEPEAQVEWSNRAAITIRVPGVSRSWSQWRTKESYGLDCRFLGKSGQFNLSQIEAFGISPAIDSHRKDVDVLKLVFQRADHLHAAELRKLLLEHVQGFREIFGKKV